MIRRIVTLAACTFFASCQGRCGAPRAPAPSSPAPPVAPAPAPAPAPSAAAPPANLKVSVDAAGVATIGDLVVDPNRRELRVPAAFCLEQGPLEFIAVARGGRDYESLVTVRTSPAAVHMGLTLLGLAQTPRNDKPPPLIAPGAPGDVLVVELEWREGEAIRRVPVEALAARRAATPGAAIEWRFTGVRMEDGRAERYDGIIANWYDPNAVVNMMHDLGNPYQGAAGLEVARDKVPKAGTAATLIIRRR